MEGIEVVVDVEDVINKNMGMVMMDRYGSAASEAAITEKEKLFG